jgi:hypothetical protein
MKVGRMNSEDSYRIAYLLMVHKLPVQLRRLIERLSFTGAAFWIHVDAKSNIEIFSKELAGLSNVHFLKERYRGDWGWFPFVEANIAGIHAIAESQFEYDHLCILSGQDYLLCANNSLITKLRDNKLVSFVQSTKIYATDVAHRGIADRVTKYHIKLNGNKKIVYPYTENTVTKRMINWIVGSMDKYPLPRIIPGDRELYFGSNWLRLSKSAVTYIRKCLREEPNYTNYFRSTFLSEEHFFHTLLLNATEEERGPITNSNFTFCHWKRVPELYKIPLGMSDLDSLLRSNDLLGRKFDQTHDCRILDFLDKNFA